MNPPTRRSARQTANLLRVLPAFVVMIMVAGCGDGGGTTAPDLPPCGPPERALTRPPKLPGSFPNPRGVTYTEAEKAGPSDIIHGYFNGDLRTGFRTYRNAFQGSGYDVIKDEQEARDAEVFFAGEGRSGQVRLDADCAGRTNITITIRPS